VSERPVINDIKYNNEIIRQFDTGGSTRIVFDIKTASPNRIKEVVLKSGDHVRKFILEPVYLERYVNELEVMNSVPGIYTIQIMIVDIKGNVSDPRYINFVVSDYENGIIRES
jgi:hypothetical protein